MKAVELFAGAGGLALGVARAGFQHVLTVELNAKACATLRANCEAGILGCPASVVLRADSRLVDYAAFGPVDFVVGGPPCQPFSLGGKHYGYLDGRDMFPEAVRAVRELRPKAFLFENVKGLLRQSFAPYLKYIVLQLRFPTLTRAEDESWVTHAKRLEHATDSRAREALEYDVYVKLLNAADYGVPQRRERVFFVGLRRDLGLIWDYPKPTHSEAALVYDQYQTGDYWRRHGIQAPNRLVGERNLRKASQFRLPPLELPWRTVRDAIGHLPPPGRAAEALDHVAIEGAKPYKGHTGSRYDEPSKTLKAGDHGVPGGENTLALGDGTVRYFTVRECACIQTFPEDYRFEGCWTEKMRQIGNAVPPLLAHAVAAEIHRLLSSRRGSSYDSEWPLVASSWA